MLGNTLSLNVLSGCKYCLVANAAQQQNWFIYNIFTLNYPSQGYTSELCSLWTKIFGIIAPVGLKEKIQMIYSMCLLIGIHSMNIC